MNDLQQSSYIFKRSFMLEEKALIVFGGLESKQ